MLLLISCAGCVPINKLVYLQKDDLKKRDFPRDTVLRSHELVFNEYKIQPLDMLSINFETLSDESDQFDFLSKLNPRMSSNMPSGGQGAAQNGVFVNPDGEIQYAVLGKIKIAGLTIFQAQEKIRDAASKYMPDVIVRVRMLNFRFTVLGEVNGEKTVTSVNPRVTMMEAIGMAGGLSELADRKTIKVIRQKGSITEVHYVNLLDEKFIESPYFYVQQNDLIIVPPLRQRTFRRYFTTNLAIVTTAISFGLLIYTLSKR
ncbi:MAG: polysaccharide export protein [Cyclobacteriaceae bacterium]|nr:polysaccharide export protein [Cyclobacteriaceae bacterium]